MRYRAWVKCVLATLAVGLVQESFAVVATQPPAGTFQMRPELQGQHPRLFFVAADIPTLQQRAAGQAKFFVDEARSSFAGYLGDPFPDPAPTDWKQYLYGDWALVTFDMLAVTRNDAVARSTAKNWALALAADRWWKQDNLPHMDALSGLSMTYDVLYHEFTEAERAQLREAIWDGLTFIRNRTFVDQYWTHDYQNNHAHNRINAMAMAAFAIYGDDPAYDVQPYADLAIQQIWNVLAWAPDDGSQHEGPGYWTFGHHWVVRMVHLAEHVTGDDLVGSSPHMTNAHLFRLYMTAPGWDHTLNIGDGGDGELANVTGMVRGIAEARDPYSTTVLRDFMLHDPDRFYQHTIWGLFWYDGNIQPRPLDELPLGRFWPDLEMFSTRSGWDDDAVAFVFKCGPVGGHTMQQIRGDDYINVAHDHPDQNHFLLYAYGKMLAADDGYPQVAKLTANHNTIIIDGNGQPREGTGWQQPFDYALTGRMLDEFQAGNTAFATGDAAPCYEEATRFLRHACFVDGRYVVLFDDLVGAGAGPHEFQWRLHNDGDWVTHAPDHFSVSEGSVSLDIRFLNDEPMTAEYFGVVETAQPGLAMTQTGQSARFLAVLVPREAGMGPLTPQRLNTVTATAVQVDGDGGRDIIVVTSSTGGPGTADIFVAGPLVGRGVAAITSFTGDDVDALMLVRGNWLMVDGKSYMSASSEVNLSRRTDGQAVIIEVAPAYKATPPGNVNLQIAGFRPGEDYAISIDGAGAGWVTPDAEGVVDLDVDVSGPRTIHLEIPTLVADAGPDQTLIDTDGNGMEFVILDGSGSFALDTTIANYVWSRAGTLVGLGEITATVLPIGEHVITLKVIDSDNAEALDTVTITVEAAAAPIPGDCDNDGDVDLDDFVILKQSFGMPAGATWANGDFDGDGDVDLDDFVILKNGFGLTMSP